MHLASCSLWWGGKGVPIPLPSGARHIHSFKSTQNWREPPYKTTILYIGPSMSFRVICGRVILGYTSTASAPQRPLIELAGNPKDVMNLMIGAIYHIRLESTCCIWTINPFEGHFVLKEALLLCNFGRLPSRVAFRTPVHRG